MNMDILFLLVPLSMVLVALVGVFLFWAVESGQFEDLEKEAQSILVDDDTQQVSTQDHNV